MIIDFLPQVDGKSSIFLRDEGRRGKNERVWVSPVDISSNEWRGLLKRTKPFRRRADIIYARKRR